MNSEHEGVEETYTDSTGEMTKLTNQEDIKITRHDKTRYSIGGGEKIPCDTVDYCTVSKAERKVDIDETKMTLSDKTGKDRNHSNTSENVQKVETYRILETDKTKRMLSDQPGEEKNHSTASDKCEQVEDMGLLQQWNIGQPSKKDCIGCQKGKRTDTCYENAEDEVKDDTLVERTAGCPTTDIVQACVDRHQNISILLCSRQAFSSYSEKCLQRCNILICGVEVTTAAVEATKSR